MWAGTRGVTYLSSNGFIREGACMWAGTRGVTYLSSNGFIGHCEHGTANVGVKDITVVVVIVIVVDELVVLTLTANLLFLIVLTVLLQPLTNALRLSHIKRFR